MYKFVAQYEPVFYIVENFRYVILLVSRASSLIVLCVKYVLWILGFIFECCSMKSMKRNTNKYGHT